MSEFYPSFSMGAMTGKVRSNFGSVPFKFDFMKYAVSQVDKTFQEINRAEIEKKQLIDLIMSVLYVNGNSSTLLSLETLFESDRPSIMKNLKRCRKPLAPKPMDDLASRSTSSATITEDLSSPDKTKPSRVNSLTHSLKRLFSKDSPPAKKAPETGNTKASEGLGSKIELSDETGFLERGSIRKEIITGKISEAENTFSFIFAQLYDSSKAIQAIFKVLRFLQLFQVDQTESLIFAKEHFSGPLKLERIQFIGASRKVEYLEVKVDICIMRKEMMKLYAIRDVERSKFEPLFTQTFKTHCADLLNNYILRIIA